MEAPLQGSEEVVGEKDTREGSVTPQELVDGRGPHTLPVESTENNENNDGDGSSSVSSAKSNILALVLMMTRILTRHCQPSSNPLSKPIL